MIDGQSDHGEALQPSEHANPDFPVKESSPWNGLELMTSSDDGTWLRERPEIPREEVDEHYAVGKGRPPREHQFPKNKSGNPRGRPPGRKIKEKALPYEQVLGRMLTVRENGVKRQMPADAAFLHLMARRALEHPSTTGRAALRMIEKIREGKFSYGEAPRPQVVHVLRMSPGTVDHAVRNLGLATLVRREGKHPQLMLEPWIVEIALVRFGETRLSLEVQQKIVAATRFPSKVRWPEWWSVGVRASEAAKRATASEPQAR